MTRFRNIVLLLVLLAPIVFHAQDVRVEAVLDTGKLRIGEQAKIDLYVSYSAREQSVSVRWPEIGDTLSSKVEVISVTGIDTTLPRESNSPRVFQHQQITVSVYDSGYYAIPGFKFVVNGDTTRPLYTKPLLLEVHTVPTDSSARSVKDIKTVFDEPFNWKWYLPYIYWAIGALLLVAAVALLIVYFTRKKKPVQAEPAKPKIPPHVTALAALEKIRDEQVWKEGFVKEYYSAISDAIRLYIEERFNVMALESTTDEIMTAFRSQVVDPESKQKLQQLLYLSDLVKFAKLMPIETEHQLTLDNAFGFVKGTMREEEMPAAAFTDLTEGPALATPPADASATATPPASPPGVVQPVVMSAGQLRKRKIRKMVIAVVSFVVFSILATYGFRKAMGYFRPSVDKQLVQISADMNSKCPVTVDRETRLDSTRVLPGRTFQYNYTLVRTDASAVDKQEFQGRMEAMILENVRTNPQFAWQRENLVTMEYVYYDRSGAFMFNIRIAPEDY